MTGKKKGLRPSSSINLVVSEFEFQASQVLVSLVHAEGLRGGVDLRRQARDLLLDVPLAWRCTSLP